MSQIRGRRQSRHFGSIDELLSCIREVESDDNFFGRPGRIEYTWARDGAKGRLVPDISTPFTGPYLYRGQTKRFFPCLPGVFRNLPLVDHPQKLSQRDRAKCFLAKVRLTEFLSVLPAHPACDYSDEIGLVLSAEALAQHYGITTDRIDFSQDPDVAAFFATNTRLEDGDWQPVRHGIGVVYRLHYPYFKKKLSQPDSLESIGKQVFPRPGVQKAWTFQLPLGLALEDYPVEVYTFAHREQCGGYFHGRFTGGRALFPLDVMSEVAEHIANDLSIARSLVDEVLRMDGCPPSIHRNELEASVGYFKREFGIKISDRGPFEFSARQKLLAEQEVRHLRKTFLNKCGVRAVLRPQPKVARELEKLIQGGGRALSS